MLYNLSMASPVLATKLYIPPSPPKVIARPRLIERINNGLSEGSKLTLIAAPAGFGKTTLISEWISRCERPVAWLSLDENDEDLSRLLIYFTSALQKISPNLGAGILDVLNASQPQSLPFESILTTLVNEITAIPDDFILVLDDYHVIDAKSIDDALTFLVEHLPPQMHLVIASREDPALPIPRLRAQRQLTELRAADLRFNPSEAAEFLNKVMELDLTDEEIASLENRTEGWIAGLQLAALSMRGREDIPEFIRAFAGDHHYIVDYLVEEVLQRQTEDVRNFLLQTSVLSRMSGPLCEAVTGQEKCNELLEALGQKNLFVVPLDDKRQWFRYHHLFVDVLRAHLVDEQPDLETTLHKRASEWYEQNGSPADAIRHALAANDFERAAGLIELAWAEMDRNRQSADWLAWAKVLPNESISARPVFSAGYAWALLDGGELEAAGDRLQDAERWLDSSVDMGKMVVSDQEEFQHLPATIASARAYHALALGDVTGTVKYARQALDLLPEEDYHRRATPAALLGLASWTSGELEIADQALTDAMTDYQMAGNILFAITGTFVLADIRVTLGHLWQTFNLYKQSLQLAEGQSRFVRWGTADLYTGLSELFCEQNDLETATEHLSRSKELGEQAALPRWSFRWYLAQARLKFAHGDLDGALDALAEAEHNFVRGPVPDVHPIEAQRARVWVMQGRIAEALNWAREQNLSADDNLSYLHEFEHITLARILIAQYRNNRKDRPILDAMRLLERLLKAAEKGGRMGSVIEVLVLQALAYEAQGKIDPALDLLARAVKLAEPEGYVRIFVDEGPPMAHLLSKAVTSGIMPDYTSKLLAVFEAKEENNKDISTRSSSKTSQPLIEPLSERELEILGLISQGLTNREIGERLFLAMPTIKGHNRNIFSKLQVKNRTEAVARARELGLL